MRVREVKKAVVLATLTAWNPKDTNLKKNPLYICASTRVNSHMRHLEMGGYYIEKGWFDWALPELRKAEAERLRIDRGVLCLV